MLVVACFVAFQSERIGWVPVRIVDTTLGVRLGVVLQPTTEKRKLRGNLANIVLFEEKTLKAETKSFVAKYQSHWLAQSGAKGWSLIPDSKMKDITLDLGSELVLRGLAVSVFWEKPDDGLALAAADARKKRRGVFQLTEPKQTEVLKKAREQVKKFWNAN